MVIPANASLTSLFSKRSQTPAIKAEAKINLPGFSISIVDDDPKERLLISIMEIDLLATYETIPDEKFTETAMGIELKITHIQLDNMYCRGAEFPVIICPKKVIGEIEEGEEGEIPFFQL
jgi:hypothetical protein